MAEQIREQVNAMHVVAGHPWLSTDQVDHDQGCPRVHAPAGRCTCARHADARPPERRL